MRGLVRYFDRFRFDGFTLNWGVFGARWAREPEPASTAPLWAAGLAGVVIGALLFSANDATE